MFKFQKGDAITRRVFMSGYLYLFTSVPVQVGRTQNRVKCVQTRERIRTILHEIIGAENERDCNRDQAGRAGKRATFENEKNM